VGQSGKIKAVRPTLTSPRPHEVDAFLERAVEPEVGRYTVDLLGVAHGRLLNGSRHHLRPREGHSAARDYPSPVELAHPGVANHLTFRPEVVCLRGFPWAIRGVPESRFF
jgi:hypothetical protein